MRKIIALLMAIMLVASIAVVSVAAADSPKVKDYYSMTATEMPKGAGKASVDNAKIKIGSDGTATFTATETGSAKFVKWEFHCEYDVISGNVSADGTSTDKVVVLRPKSDINAIAYFEGYDKATADQSNKDTTSPKTGDMTLVFAGIMLLALGAGVFAVKKIKE